jgi:hypothetical protein
MSLLWLMCVCVCKYLCMYVCMYSIYVCIVCIYVCMYSMYICMYICIHIYICMYLRMYLAAPPSLSNSSSSVHLRHARPHSPFPAPALRLALAGSRRGCRSHRGQGSGELRNPRIMHCPSERVRRVGICSFRARSRVLYCTALHCTALDCTA